jgi:tetratricopeptide (TPR) repeat protein
LGPIEAEELGWYLERWPVWPNPVLADRARKVESNLIAWGQALHDAALPLDHTANVLQGWAGVGEGASRRFSVTVDASLVSGASEEEQNAAQEAATALLGLPWELLHNGKGFLFQGARPVRVRRRLPNKDNLSVPVVAPPIRVLLITARPEDEACGYIDHRASSLPLVAATEELGDLLRLTQLQPPTYPALEAELARAQQAGEPYHVVHFNGHGIYDRRVGLGGLCFEDPNDNQKLTRRGHQTVLTDRLGPLLTDYRIPLVFLEACQSAKAEQDGESVASELLQRGVASVVAMSHSVLVETARRFVAAFYGELAKGQRVGQAMLAGQQALHSDRSRGQRYGIGELSLQDWFVPVLYQEKQDPQLFEATPAPQTREDIRERLRARLGAVPPEPVDTGFVGRSRDLLALERLLRQERWAVLRGQGGEGKTALAAELARWLVRSQQVRRAAFVSVELCSHEGAVLDALGRQLVNANYSTAKFENTDQALQPIERALKEQPTLVVIDNMESVLLPPYLDTPELLSEEAADELAAILKLAERLLRAGETRIVFTSREALPAPFVANRQLRELHQLGRNDAVALIERALATGDEETGGERTLEARREAIEELAEAVQCHARTLALLGPELRRRGVEATREVLVELMEEMERQVAHLPADDPRRREQSLFASVELSLRRLSAVNRERARVLGVFHGGVQLGVLAAITCWDRTEVEGLAIELVGTGLATANNHYLHLSLNPSLCPYLKGFLKAKELAEINTRWHKAMSTYLEYLYQLRTQKSQHAAAQALIELPNLFAMLDHSHATADHETTIDQCTQLFGLLQWLGKPRLLERVGRVRAAAAAALGGDEPKAHFQVNFIRIQQQLADGQLQEALEGARGLLEFQRGAGEQAYADADYDLAMACLLFGRILQTAGGAESALHILQEAGQRFEAFAKDRPYRGAEEMALVCLTEQGDCLTDLGRYDEAATIYMQNIRSAEERGAIRSIAVGRLQLGTVRLHQERLREALADFQDAMERFTHLNEPGTVAATWHQIGLVLAKLGESKSAEKAFYQSLALKVRLQDNSGQPSTLTALGDLYADIMQQPEEAVVLYKRAIYLFSMIGDKAKQILVCLRLAHVLHQLRRFDDARHTILQAINCQSQFVHASMPWKAWSLLSDIESEAGNTTASIEARRKAITFFVAYRNDGGENHSIIGELSFGLRQTLAAGYQAVADSKLRELAARSDWANFLPFLAALQAITSGSRDRTLAEDHGMSYIESAEVLLLIEALEKGECK